MATTKWGQTMFDYVSFRLCIKNQRWFQINVHKSWKIKYFEYLWNLRQACVRHSAVRNLRLHFKTCLFSFLKSKWLSVLTKTSLKSQKFTWPLACIYVIVRIRNQSLYTRTAVISFIIYNDCKKSIIIYNDQLKPVIIYNDQQFSLPFHKQTSLFV